VIPNFTIKTSWWCSKGRSIRK